MSFGISRLLSADPPDLFTCRLQLSRSSLAAQYRRTVSRCHFPKFAHHEKAHVFSQVGIKQADTQQRILQPPWHRRVRCIQPRFRRLVQVAETKPQLSVTRHHKRQECWSRQHGSSPRPKNAPPFACNRTAAFHLCSKRLKCYSQKNGFNTTCQQLRRRSCIFRQHLSRGLSFAHERSLGQFRTLELSQQQHEQRVTSSRKTSSGPERYGQNTSWPSEAQSFTTVPQSPQQW